MEHIENLVWWERRLLPLGPRQDSATWWCWADVQTINSPNGMNGGELIVGCFGCGCGARFPRIDNYKGGQRRAGGVDCCGGRTTGTVVYVVRPLNSRKVPVGRVYTHNNQTGLPKEEYYGRRGGKASEEPAVVVVGGFRTRVRISQNMKEPLESKR